jgi:hypothetical protein
MIPLGGDPGKIAGQCRQHGIGLAAAFAVRRSRATTRRLMIVCSLTGHVPPTLPRRSWSGHQRPVAHRSERIGRKSWPLARANSPQRQKGPGGEWRISAGFQGQEFAPFWRIFRVIRKSKLGPSHESFYYAQQAGQPFRLWSGFFLGFELKLPVDPDQRALFDLQPAVNRIDEKRELAPSVTARFRCAPDLPVGKINSHFREYKARLSKSNVTKRIHANE